MMADQVKIVLTACDCVTTDIGRLKVLLQVSYPPLSVVYCDFISRLTPPEITRLLLFYKQLKQLIGCASLSTTAEKR